MNKTSTIIKLIASALIIALGLVVMILGNNEDFTYDYWGTYTSDQTYGGDAYTGIQNALADVSYNVSELGYCFEFYTETVHPIIGYIGGSLIMLIGTYMLGASLKGFEKKKAKGAEAPDTAATAYPTAPTANKSNEDAIAMLSKYKALLDSGAITQEEFDAKKKQLLGL